MWNGASSDINDFIALIKKESLDFPNQIFMEPSICNLWRSGVIIFEKIDFNVPIKRKTWYYLISPYFKLCLERIWHAPIYISIQTH